MSKVLCEKSDLVAIADSVRSKTGSTDGMKVSEIPQKIEAIETGSNINIQANKSVTITSNGTATITPDDGYDGLSSVDVTVDVPASSTPILQEKTVTITENGTTEVTPDSGQDGLSKVAVTTSVSSIISGPVAEVIPVAYECLKKAQTSHDNTYRKFFKYGVPVFFFINVQGGLFLSWGPLRFSEDNPTNNSLGWKSRVFSKSETGLAYDIFFLVTFRIKDGVVDTENYRIVDVSPNIHSPDGVSPTLVKSTCATISDWLI